MRVTHALGVPMLCPHNLLILAMPLHGCLAADIALEFEAICGTTCTCVHLYLTKFVQLPGITVDSQYHWTDLYVLK